MQAIVFLILATVALSMKPSSSRQSTNITESEESIPTEKPLGRLPDNHDQSSDPKWRNDSVSVMQPVWDVDGSNEPNAIGIVNTYTKPPVSVDKTRQEIEIPTETEEEGSDTKKKTPANSGSRRSPVNTAVVIMVVLYTCM